MREQEDYITIMEIKSTLTKYPGTIILPDYLTPDQVFAVEDAQFAARGYWRENTITETVKDEEGKDKEEVRAGERFSLVRARALYLPAVLLCVKEWKLENFPLNGNGAKMEEFPMTPVSDVSDLLQWTFNEIVKIYNGASEVPNE